MNKFLRLSLLLTILTLATATLAADYAPKSFSLYNVTKRQKVSVRGMPVVTVNPSKATSVYLNGTGNDWLVGAGAERDIYIFRNISTLTFTNASTSTADPNKLRVMVH